VAQVKVRRLRDRQSRRWSGDRYREKRTLTVDPQETFSFIENGHSSGGLWGCVSTIASDHSLNLSEPIQLAQSARYLVYEAWAAANGPSGCVSRNQPGSL
jgi:hypothetical protein